jgi:hypothetical protein
MSSEREARDHFGRFAGRMMGVRLLASPGELAINRGLFLQAGRAVDADASGGCRLER